MYCIYSAYGCRHECVRKRGREREAGGAYMYIASIIPRPTSRDSRAEGEGLARKCGTQHDRWMRWKNGGRGSSKEDEIMETRKGEKIKMRYKRKLVNRLGPEDMTMRARRRMWEQVPAEDTTSRGRRQDKRIVQDCPLPITQHTVHPNDPGDSARDDPAQQSERRSNNH